MMAYASGYVVSIIANGLPLRESAVDDIRTVRLPFGSEYKIRLKNNTKVRAMAQVCIDGSDISSVGKFIVGPGESVDLERFVDNHKNGKKFKFISREQGAATGELADPTSQELGFISVKFWKETGLMAHLMEYQGSVQNLGSLNVRGLQGGVQTLKGTSLKSQASDLRHSYTNQPSYSATYSSDNSDWVESNATLSNASAPNLIGEEQTKSSILRSSIGGTSEGSASNQMFQVSSGFEVESFATDITLRILAPEISKRDSYAIEDGWVVRNPGSVRVSNNFRVENGSLWVKLD